jgi:hypothetical protein
VGPRGGGEGMGGSGPKVEASYEVVAEGPGSNLF